MLSTLRIVQCESNSEEDWLDLKIVEICLILPILPLKWNFMKFQDRRGGILRCYVRLISIFLQIVEVLKPAVYFWPTRDPCICTEHVVYEHVENIGLQVWFDEDEEL